MVNSKQFSKRLEKIMSYYDLSAASFADKIQVGRSSISHILSGRNKPSLEFVMKIVQSFPEVELYWLLNGKGMFPKNESPTPTSEINSMEAEKRVPEKTIFKKNEVVEEKSIQEKIPLASSKKEIRKIVIFYEDGSFEAFQN
jgi:transcriptional regulator with XRE-family HTH domain